MHAQLQCLAGVAVLKPLIAILLPAATASAAASSGAPSAPILCTAQHKLPPPLGPPYQLLHLGSTEAKVGRSM